MESCTSDDCKIIPVPGIETIYIHATPVSFFHAADTDLGVDPRVGVILVCVGEICHVRSTDPRGETESCQPIYSTILACAGEDTAHDQSVVVL